MRSRRRAKMARMPWPSPRLRSPAQAVRSARPTATAEAVLAGGPPSQTRSLLFNPLFNSCVYITVVVILYRFVWFFLEEETTRLLLLRYPAPDPAPEAGPSSEERRLDRTSLMSTKRNLRANELRFFKIFKFWNMSVFQVHFWLAAAWTLVAVSTWFNQSSKLFEAKTFQPLVELW